MSFFILIVLASEKYLAKNLSANTSHVMSNLTGKEFNQLLALFFKEKENSLSLMASSVTPLCLNVSQISIKLVS